MAPVYCEKAGLSWLRLSNQFDKRADYSKRFYKANRGGQAQFAMNRELVGRGRTGTHVGIEVRKLPFKSRELLLMPRFSEVFGIAKTQAELDFVDVNLNTDMPLFIDPFAIKQRPDPLSQTCTHTLIDFFQHVVDNIRAGNEYEAKKLLSFLREPNETRLGFSKKRPQGAGIGDMQAEQVYEALKGSSAVKTGFLSSLEECELMVEGISRDKLSDLATNVLRSHLVAYTQDQCKLHGVPMAPVPVPPCFNPETMEWVSQYAELPVHDSQIIVLVPKAIVRYDPAYEHHRYYRHFVLAYLQAEHMNAGSSLVRTLKDGRRRVYKKDLIELFPCTKEFLYQFSKDHPDVLAKYREHLKEAETDGKSKEVDQLENDLVIAEALSTALKLIPGGNADATTYHRLMIGVLEFVFFPNLLSPKKEAEIHDGRKRIDIVMENGARDGIFQRLRDFRKLPCSFVAIECKNYTREIENPELDQIGGRFSPLRGKVGIICCRRFNNRSLFVQRCKDTLADDRGFILPLDDERVLELLDTIQLAARHKLDDKLTGWANELFF